MRILFLTAYLPYPLNFGGARRLHGLMTGVARSHSLSIAALVEKRGDRSAAIRATGDLAERVIVVESGRSGPGLAAKRGLKLRSLLSPYSFERYAYRHRAFQAALDGLLARERFDVVHVESAHLVGYSLPPELPVVVDEQNVEYEVLARSAASGNPVRRLYNVVNGWKLRHEEQQAWRAVDGCAIPSEREVEIVRAAAPRTLTAVVPNAVDTEFFAPRHDLSAPDTILFFGALNYYPNVDGLTYFVRDVLPSVRRSHSEARLVVAGIPAEAPVRALDEPGVRMLGEVSDIRTAIAGAAVVVAPLRIGGGTRLKVLEAMAMGRPVVATSLGAEGIVARDGQHLLIADTPDEFAGAVTRLLGDADLRKAIGEAGRRLVEQQYDWRQSTVQLERLYRAVLARRRRSPLEIGAPPARWVS